MRAALIDASQLGPHYNAALAGFSWDVRVRGPVRVPIKFLARSETLAWEVPDGTGGSIVRRPLDWRPGQRADNDVW